MGNNKSEFSLKRVVNSIINIVLILVIINAFIGFKHVSVEGSSMNPTLFDGDKGWSVKYRKWMIDRGNIVLVKAKQESGSFMIIKRVVGMPGDTISIKNGEVIINGEIIIEDYIDPNNNKELKNMDKIKLGKNIYFVLGDNRDNSTDSRIFGPVHVSNIYSVFLD